VAITKLSRFWSGGQQTSAPPQAVTTDAADALGLSAFGSEEPCEDTDDKPGLAVATRAASLAAAVFAFALGGRYLSVLRWTGIIILSAGTAAAGMWAYQRRPLAPPATTSLTVETTPPGLDVRIGGQLMGKTPLTLQLPPGPYDVQLGSGAQQRLLQATLAPGVARIEHVELAPPAPASKGALYVRTDPRGQRILLAGGWLAVSSPVALQLREGGKVIGTTDAERVMLPSGEHNLELVNESLGYVAQRRVTIAAGKTARLAIDVPKGTLSVNAQPWADIWLDGRSLGETPIGNISTPIGSHEIVFRHPELGERRETIVVGLKQQARIGIDMRRK
jgi:PEGA domain